MISAASAMPPSLPGAGNAAPRSAAVAGAGSTAPAGPTRANADAAAGQSPMVQPEASPAPASGDEAHRGTDFDAVLSDALLGDAGASPLAASETTSPLLLPTSGKFGTGLVDLPPEPTSPEQLLAMLGAWTQPTIVTPSSPAMPATTAPAMPAASGALGAAAGGWMPAVTADAQGSAILPATAATAATDIAAGTAADFLGQLATAESTEAAATAGTEPAPLTAPTAPSAITAMRATATIAAPIAMPADPDAGFDDAFGARIAWMAEQRLGHAEIRVTPDNAGPIDVRVHLDGTRVSAEFNSANPEVRHALEASMARLREMLGQHGLQLAHAGVGDGQASGRRGNGEAPSRGGDPGDDDGRVSTGPIRRSLGLLDEYA